MSLNANQHVLAILDVSANQSDMTFMIQNAFERDHPEVSVRRRQRALANLQDESLGAQAVANQVRYRDDFQPVLLGEFLEVGHARHRPIFFHDLADHS